MSERRVFSRVIFHTPATLILDHQEWPTRLLDLSLKGALVDKPANWQPPASNTEMNLTFTLVGSTIELSMQVDLCHSHEQHLGLHCRHIDIESATHLKRLIQLNVGNGEMLDREIEHLVSEPEI